MRSFKVESFRNEKTVNRIFKQRIMENRAF